MQRSSSNDYRKFIENKTCVVVAPSGQLERKGLCDFIESFDYVVKTNNMYRPQHLNDDLGRRVDILYCPPVGKALVDSEEFLSSRCKFLCFLPSFKSQWKIAHEKLLRSIKNLKISVKMPDQNEKADCASKFNSVPLTGVYAINDLLNQGAKKVFALGFDFYRSGYSIKQFTDETPILNGWHDHVQDMEFIENLIQNEERFDCDNNLKSILDHEFNKKHNSQDWFFKNFSEQFNFYLTKFRRSKILLARTINEKAFANMLPVIKRNFEGDVFCLAQKGFPLKGKFHQSRVTRSVEKDSIKISPELAKSLRNLRFKLMICPYNGEPLYKYKNIVEIALELNIEKILFVSESGNTRIFSNLPLMLQSIEEYEQNFTNLMILHDKYGKYSIL